MITRSGKKHIAKFLLGHAPAFATHISVGCGADPVVTGSDEEPANGWRKNLEFEVARATITGRGIVQEDGSDFLVFNAELPIESRYQITELGLWSEHSNLRAGQFDSKQISQFNAPIESWFLQDGTNNVSPLEVLTVDPTDASNEIAPSGLSGSAIKIAYLSTSNPLWTTYTERIDRKEFPRFGNGCVLVEGDYSDITYNPEDGWVVTNEYGIETSGLGVNLVKNSPDDEIRFAFAVVSKELVDTTPLPADTFVNIWLEFVNNTGEKKYAKAKVQIGGDVFYYTRYYVYTFKKSDFATDAGFSWASINGIRVFSSIQTSNVVNPNFFLVYDGIRLENVSSESPTYSMVAYTQVFSTDAQPYVKTENTNNHIEFRLKVQDI